MPAQRDGRRSARVAAPAGDRAPQVEVEECELLSHREAECVVGRSVRRRQRARADVGVPLAGQVVQPAPQDGAREGELLVEGHQVGERGRVGPWADASDEPGAPE